MTQTPRRYNVTFGATATNRQVMTVDAEDVATMVRLLVQNRCASIDIAEVVWPSTAGTLTLSRTTNWMSAG